MVVERSTFHLLLCGATLIGCPLRAEAATAAVSKEEMPGPMVLSHLEGLNALRATGVSCPGGLHVQPNRVPLKFDCILWKAAELQLQPDKSAGSLLPSSTRTQEFLQLVQGNSSSLVSADGTAAWLKASDDHCRKLMDPAVRVVGIAHHSATKTDQQQHTWLHAIGAAEMIGDTSCLRIKEKPAVSQAAHEAAGRRLKPSGGGADTSAGEEQAAPEEEEPYEGPGQTFGMVLLIVSISIFCTCTFGSIIIGNYVLYRNGGGTPSEQPEPMS